MTSLDWVESPQVVAVVARTQNRCCGLDIWDLYFDIHRSLAIAYSTRTAVEVSVACCHFFPNSTISCPKALNALTWLV